MKKPAVDVRARMKRLRDVALSVLFGEETVPYEPNQIKSLSADVADVLARTDSAEKQDWVSMGSSYPTLSEADEELLREVLSELQREGVILEGLNAANPRWPFFRLSSQADEILAAQRNGSNAAASGSDEDNGRETAAGNKADPQSSEAHVAHANAPKVFISYSWDNDNHKKWVREFATRLRADGINATLDQWTVVPGDRLPHFMEQAIRENSYVLIVCTPKYKEKSDKRMGGVGYEGDIMTAEVYAKGNHRKFIPILRSGEWKTAIPSWLSGKYGIDMSSEPESEEAYNDLIATLHNLRDQAPPVGPGPKQARPESIRDAARAFLPTKEKADKEFEPIKIVGVLADEAGEPLNDGTAGSALYAVPFKLSRAPTTEWTDLFIRTWDRPPQFTLSHRPGIARVQGDRIILTRTTIEEVQKAHRDTLKLVVDTVNETVADLVRKRRTAETAKAEQSTKHREDLKRVADDIKFD